MTQEEFQSIFSPLFKSKRKERKVMLLAPAHVLKGTKNKAASGENGHHHAGGAVTNQGSVPFVKSQIEGGHFSFQVSSDF